MLDSGLIVVILSCLLASTTAQDEECRKPYLPYTEVCSGHGSCNSGVCVCNPGFSGNGIWFDLTPYDCNINDTALKVLIYIAYAMLIIIALATLYRIYTLGRLQICSKNLVRQSIKNTQITLLLILVAALFGVAQYTFFSVAHYPHWSWPSALVFLFFHLTYYTYTWYRGTSVVIAATKVASSLRQNMQKKAKRVRLLGLALNVMISIGHTIALAGVVASPTVDMKYGFMITYFVTSFVYNLSWLLAMGKSYTIFIRAMTEHLNSSDALGAKLPNRNEIEDSINKLRRLRMAFLGVVIFHGSFCVICIILPPIASYYVPIWQATGVLATLSYIREVGRPQSQEDTGKTTSVTVSASGNSLMSDQNP